MLITMKGICTCGMEKLYGNYDITIPRVRFAVCVCAKSYQRKTNYIIFVTGTLVYAYVLHPKELTILMVPNI